MAAVWQCPTGRGTSTKHAGWRDRHVVRQFPRPADTALSAMEYYPALVPGDPMTAAARTTVTAKGLDRAAAGAGLSPRTANHATGDGR
jgi:hypothetical protein